MEVASGMRGGQCEKIVRRGAVLIVGWLPLLLGDEVLLEPCTGALVRK